jgi:hypothetical protein
MNITNLLQDLIIPGLEVYGLNSSTNGRSCMRYMHDCFGESVAVGNILKIEETTILDQDLAEEYARRSLVLVINTVDTPLGFFLELYIKAINIL